MNTGKAQSAIISIPDNVNVANNPTRAECAVDKINPKIGIATTKPIKHAIALIFATMICIWFAMNLSVAPTWFNISNSCLCNRAILRDIHDTHTPIEANINTIINIVIDTNFHPADIEFFNAAE